MSEDLFSAAAGQARKQTAPLAERLRPRRLDEVIGQQHLLGPEGMLRRMLEAKQLRSLILWGPPGSGKTTIARLLADAAGVELCALSAVLSGVKDIREAVAAARQRLGQRGQRTALFVDEIHRFNKAQQDALLPHVEDGTVILIGATTENPSFEVNAPLLSRARVLVLQALDEEAMQALIDRALQHEHGLPGRELSPEARAALVGLGDADGRRLLGTLELAADLAAEGERIDISHIEQAAQNKWIRHDQNGEDHYNVVSALIKCLRDSDPDAALYWCMRMVEAGEDPMFIARRLVIFAAEDIGLADPQALLIANGVKDSVHFVGMPEARIPLAMACTYLATAPKSKASYRAMHAAIEDVHRQGALPVPLNLRNAPTGLMKNLGYGQGYVDAHKDPAAASAQAHWPEGMQPGRYYHPTANGREQRLREWMGRGKQGDDDA
ncbi:MAG: replication-associated recombination protein A [Oceanococcaceae bacterium]